jgi:hypothetical protein
MQEVFLDDVDQAFATFREKLKKYMDYLNYLETQVRADRLTVREKEMIRKHGRKNRGEKK